MRNSGRSTKLWFCDLSNLFLIKFKFSESEKLVRQRDEEIFTLTSDRMALQCDLKNLRLTEGQLKAETHALSQKRMDLERVVGDLKGEVHSLGSQVRALEQEAELLRREGEQYRAENEALTRELGEMRQAAISERHSLMEVEMQTQIRGKQWDLERKAMDTEIHNLRALLDALRNAPPPVVQSSVVVTRP